MKHGIDEKLYLESEKAQLSLKNALINFDEIERLKENGFEILNPILKVPFHQRKGIYAADISWENPFGDIIPEDVQAYIDAPTEMVFPKGDFNFAQYLWAKASRARHRKQ